MSTPSQYRPLLGKRRTLLGNSSLWLGPDHLLSVRSYRLSFREEYRRYYFREIQAICLQDLSGVSIVRWWDVVALVAILLLAMFAVKGWVSGGIIACLALLYIAAMLRRPTCRCSIYTAVSSEVLRSLHRVRRAERALEHLQPLIRESQQNLPDLPAGEVVAVPVAAPPVSRTAYGQETPPALASGHAPLSARLLYAHAALFSLLPLDAIFGLLSARAPSLTLVYVNALLLLAETACAGATLVQPDAPVAASLRGIVVGSLFYLYGRYMFAYVVNVLSAAIRRQPMKTVDLTTIFSSAYPYAYEANVVLAVLAFGLAGSGFYFLWRERQRYAAAES